MLQCITTLHLVTLCRLSLAQQEAPNYNHDIEDAVKSERASSFLTAHQHKIGHSVPWCG